MSLTGNLRTMSLPDILQWIASGRKTGTLHLQRRSIHKRIVFRDGNISTSWSNDPRESLGQFLIREGRITEEQLFRALSRQEEEGTLLGVILINDATLDEKVLRQVLRLKAEETIYDIFGWPEGQFEFKEGELPRDTLVNVDIGVTEVVLEGIRRVDEWGRIRKAFPSAATSFKILNAGGAENAAERQALGLISAGKTLGEIALELRRTEFDASALLFELCARDVIAVDRIQEETSATDPVGAIQEFLALAHKRLQERRYDSALQAYERVLALDRLNQNAKKGLLTVSEARERDRARKSVRLDKVPVLKLDMSSLTRQSFEPQEAFVLSRINGAWDVQSILKICPMTEDEALLIFARLLDRNVIELR